MSEVSKICASGRHTYIGRRCPECTHERNAKWRASNASHIVAYGAKYRASRQDAQRQHNANYRIRNPEKIKLARDEYRKNNREKLAFKKREHYAQNNTYDSVRRRMRHECNRQLDNAASSAWRSANPSKVAMYAASRRAAILQATPVWADSIKIEEFYFTANMLGMHTGDEYHVDHIVPLRGKNVCGLHWEGNLQILTAEENIAKGNRL